VKEKKVDSLYFGGGTPSLLKPVQLDKIISSFKESGFIFDDNFECSIEINPGTIDQNQIENYLKIGINRFSLGAQSFNDDFLKNIGRLHSSKDTIDSIEILNNNKLNYSFDLLFALPKQSLKDLQTDLKKIERYLPPHISSYYLTIPKKHQLNKNRAPEEEQLQMFDFLESALSDMGYEQYEISNFARNKKYARHNLSAWLGGHYWGIGVSAHSHLQFKEENFRFWNPNTINSWQNSLEEQMIGSWNDESLYEKLRPIDIANDSVHTGLRLSRGFRLETIDKAFHSELLPKLSKLQEDGFLLLDNEHWKLNKKGRRLLNYVLENLFLA
jgi:oxygen-independent coproporphyrinogen-3 oxidase